MGHDSVEVPYSLDTPLEDMLASYGDSMASNWTDQRYEVWRDAQGAAIGYQRLKGHAVVWGNPVCLKTRAVVSHTVQGFEKYCKSQGLRPIFCCIDAMTEDILCNAGFKSVSPASGNVASGHDKDNRSPEATKKIRRAERHDVRVEVFAGLPPDDLRAKIEDALANWQKGRSGKQVHTSSLSPFRDPEHRHYFVSLPKEGEDEIYGLLVMTEITDGQYIKWSLEMPGAPSGTSELQAATAIDWARGNGAAKVSWGSGASDSITPGHHISQWKLRIMYYIYEQIHGVFKLGQKVEYRRKLGLVEETEFVAFRAFNLRSLLAIISSIEE